ncbi:MAG TPA: hypothetical protein VEL07_20645 [Planctomycetota bacterium]|nr:hypothetical protein [Planctomycetota bacterium]
MRFLLRVVLIAGLLLIAWPWIPARLRPASTAAVPARTIQIAGGAAVALAIALALATRRRRDGEADDAAEIRARLADAGFRFTDLDRGWQAEGLWQKERVVVRKVSDVHATRFGRPWTLLITLPGTPREPWPFLPDQGGIVERGNGTFTVVAADLGLAGRSARLGSRLDHLLAARE